MPFPQTFARSAVLAVALALAGSGCREGPTGPEAGLAAARARWARRGPGAYTITVFRLCLCPRETSEPVAVTVRRGAATIRVYAGSGAPVPAQYADAFPTVDALFAMIEAGARAGTRPIQASYNASLGYPTRVAVGDPATDAPVYVANELRPR